ncbi:MAG: radical SAM protein [Coriobacteriia bacterium]|nr:radical SAM protein [Coriobacteriia bacterium]MCL2746206.1 radical SAM protein [Coriobacteriia bacterium]MCL2870363.1 radical SAM protein [Coriobacteriia bacterium]
MYHYGDYKTILSPKGGMNLYRGCTHGCIYCDTRSECYQMKNDLEDIEVKRNAVQILEVQLTRKRKKHMISSGSMCDSYIPLEEELQVTRRCLEVIARHGFGLSILTKSTLILRDLDLLTQINEQSKCVVQTTFTTFDEDLCRRLEPQVATTRERFEMLCAMRDAGIPTVVWLGPILPYINDSEENLRGLLDYCVQAEVKGILCFGFGMTLRKGSREYYYEQLDKLFPGMKDRYIADFGEDYSILSPHNARLWSIFEATCRKHGIIYRTDDVWSYLGEFPEREDQLQLF